jgi:hypothetical protein
MPGDLVLASLIGDVVNSKTHGDRRRLQHSLEVVLAVVNKLLDPAQPLEVTVGDEFQGGFSNAHEAILASLLVRLRLLMADDEADSRYGLGVGAVTVFDRSRTPMSQDGPAWWAARASIERAGEMAESPRTSFVRTCFSDWTEDDERHSDAAAIESFLYSRDGIVDRMSRRQRRLLCGLMFGFSQAQLAHAEGIKQGAVSQSLHRSGAFVIQAAQNRLERG